MSRNILIQDYNASLGGTMKHIIVVLSLFLVVGCSSAPKQPKQPTPEEQRLQVMQEQLEESLKQNQALQKQLAESQRSAPATGQSGSRRPVDMGADFRRQLDELRDEYKEAVADLHEVKLDELLGKLETLRENRARVAELQQNISQFLLWQALSFQKEGEEELVYDDELESAKIRWEKLLVEMEATTQILESHMQRLEESLHEIQQQHLQRWSPSGNQPAHNSPPTP